MSNKALLLLILCELIMLVSFCLSDNFTNTYFLYMLAVVSGNWGYSDLPHLNIHFFIFGALIAVALNAVTIAAIIKGVIELSTIRRDRAMVIKNAFNIRNRLAFKHIKEVIAPLTTDMTESDADALQKEIWDCFEKADQEWEHNYIPDASEDRGKRFFAAIQQSP